jgi:hypothetical protein
MFLIEFNTQSIMHSKSLIKANITSAKKSYRGEGALQAKSYVLKFNSVKCAHKWFDVDYFFLYCQM